MNKLLCLVSVVTFILSGCAANQMMAPACDQEVRGGGMGYHAQHHVCSTYNPAYITHRVIAHRARITPKPVEKPLKAGPSTPLLTDGFATVTYHPDQQPLIQTAPFQITVIALEPGEQFTNITSGDPTRWSYAIAVAGKAETAQQHILVKPSFPDIRTNLVITTNRRLYNLQLIATDTPHVTRHVAFYYPDDKISVKTDKNRACEEESIEEQSYPLLPHARHVAYRITTSGWFKRPPLWQPLRVWEDGVHAFIEFPEHICQGELPALFLIKEGQKACVNYRFNAPVMIVDTLFTEALLVTGVGGSQEAVTITRVSDEAI